MNACGCNGKNIKIDLRIYSGTVAHITGDHYFIDGVAGSIIAVSILYCTDWIIKKQREKWSGGHDANDRSLRDV
jgi:hypothetical protein